MNDLTLIFIIGGELAFLAFAVRWWLTTFLSGGNNERH